MIEIKTAGFWEHPYPLNEEIAFSKFLFRLIKYDPFKTVPHNNCKKIIAGISHLLNTNEQGSRFLAKIKITSFILYCTKYLGFTMERSNKQRQPYYLDMNILFTLASNT